MRQTEEWKGGGGGGRKVNVGFAWGQEMQARRQGEPRQWDAVKRKKQNNRFIQYSCYKGKQLDKKFL